MKARYRTWAVRLSLLLALGAVAGFLVAASGVIPIKASSGHWAVTEWFLQFSKERSVATHSLRVELPRLDVPWRIAKGAAHYETACRPCHGSPEHRHPRIAAAMLPPPPYLPALIPDRDSEALYYVVKHGIKFTGMPAWPSQQRDDEIHAMVAFLVAFPALDADAYRRLAYGAAGAGPPAESLRGLAGDASASRRALVASCDRCHGSGGAGRETSAFPRLAGQKREYLRRALAAYERDQRHSGIMSPIVAAISAEDQRMLADHYSSIASPPLAESSLDPAAARGRAIAERGIASQGVPPCQDCHGPGPHPRNPAYPNLAGQYDDYLLLQLELFKRGERGGSEYAHIMQQIADRLTADQMRDAAAYYGSFASPPDSPRAER